tara:strand:- start:107551 stop:108543 length:993 start_codon:yes stop_codon:yes gene_type:complete
MTDRNKRVHVAVGVIINPRGEVLIAKRASKQHLGGLWEFPGGKLEADEDVRQALARELHEELGIIVTHQTPLCIIRHNYPDKAVLLDVWTVHGFTGQPHGREGQPLRWVKPGELAYNDFPEANRAIIRAIRLPGYMALIDLPSPLIPGDFDHPDQLPDNTLIRLRRTTMPTETEDKKYVSSVRAFLDAGILAGHPIVVDINANPALQKDLAQALHSHSRFLGYFANRHTLRKLTERPEGDQVLLGCACHSDEELMQAAALSADFATVSPVLPTSSHPDQPGMGWDVLSGLADRHRIPVYAMGGLSLADLTTARAAGARGIAGISMFKRKK